MKRDRVDKPRIWPPTPTQGQVLRAALLPSWQALAAWQAWCAEVDIERSHPDAGSYALLGLVGRNLGAAAPDDPMMGRLRGIWRRNWYINQGRMQAAVGVMETLQRADIGTLLLDGAAMIAAYYGDPGLRSLEAVTLLVRPIDAPCALVTLAGAGWQIHPAVRPDYFTLTHACTLTRPGGQPVRVQWRLVAHDARPDADEAVWTAARTASLQGQPARVPAPPHLLLSLCSDVFGAPPHCGWPRLADMAALLRASTLDWAGVIEQARQRRMAGLLRLVLGFLADLDAALPIEPDVLAALDTVPQSKAESTFCAAVQQPLTLARRAGLGWRFWQLAQENSLRAGAKFAWHVRYAPDRFGARAAVRRMISSAQNERMRKSQ